MNPIEPRKARRSRAGDRSHSRRRIVMALLAGLASVAASAAEFVAPYVPSAQEDVDVMLELADVGPADYLIDLGSGDGRIVITAAFRGAMGHGVELDRELVALAHERARNAEVEDLVTFVEGDIFQTDVRPASVVTLYLMPEVNLRLRPRLLAELRPGTRVVSNSFDMGEWRPDRQAMGRSSGGIMLWIVPADVDGRWSLRVDDQRLELSIDQLFQEFSATLSHDGARHHMLQTALRGDRIAFLSGEGANRYAFSGRVDGARMSGVVQIHGLHDGDARVAAWTAERR
ncbi:MAG: class I SAM-dependent methyltransferase [Pseudomonadales bacterium]